MKKSLTIALVAACTLLVPSLTHAQERVTVDVNYIGGWFVSGFDYPHKPALITGKSYDANGVEVSAKVAITDVISVNGRYEHVGLRNAQFFIDDHERYQGGNVPGLQTEPDLQAIGGSVNYWELSGSFKLPKTRGHSLIVGVAKANLRRESSVTYTLPPLPSVPTSRPMPPTIFPPITVNSSLEAQQIAMLVGGEGSQRLRDVTFNYAGRVYPRMYRKDGWSSREVGGRNMKGEGPDQSSVGWELRVMATWAIVKHVGLTGGYEFRRLRTEVPNGFWPINENQDSKLVLVGLRIGF